MSTDWPTPTRPRPHPVLPWCGALFCVPGPSCAPARRCPGQLGAAFVAAAVEDVPVTRSRKPPVGPQSLPTSSRLARLKRQPEQAGPATRWRCRIPRPDGPHDTGPPSSPEQRAKRPRHRSSGPGSRRQRRRRFLPWCGGRLWAERKRNAAAPLPADGMNSTATASLPARPGRPPSPRAAEGWFRGRVVGREKWTTRLIWPSARPRREHGPR